MEIFLGGLQFTVAPRSVERRVNGKNIPPMRSSQLNGKGISNQTLSEAKQVRIGPYSVHGTVLGIYFAPTNG